MRAFLLLLGICVLACVPGVPTASRPQGRTLVLYDDGGAYGWLGELYGMGTGVFASHFGSWSAMPVTAYRRGEMRRYDAAIYVGSTFDHLLPDSFIDDVSAGSTPVLWMGHNVWQLAKRAPDFESRFGFVPGLYDRGPFQSIVYKGVHLRREVEGGDGILGFERLDPSLVRVVGHAVRPDGTQVPWAIRTRSLTFIAENPLPYITPGDRSLAFADLLFEVLDPNRPERHRAVVRIEDVSPRSSPDALRDIADRLAARGIPFSIALIPIFDDPNRAHGGEARTRLCDAPPVVDALRYMLTRGGSLVLHGYTHQYRDQTNPYDGSTGADFEFYRAHLESERVVLDGPVAEDSAEWATDRVQRALEEVAAVDLPQPRVFEFPHYVGSAVDSRAIARLVSAAFHRPLLFAEPSRSLGLIVPYAVSDVYGWSFLPENLGHYLPAEGEEPILARARAVRVVRDGVAGFFFHPTYDAAVLERLVDGITAAGYTFVSAETLLPNGR